MKLLKLLADMRDFCYVRAEKKHGVKYAEKEHKFDLKVLFSPYFIAFLTILAILKYKTGIMFNITDIELIQIILVMTPAVILYNIIFNYIYTKLSLFPMDKNMGEKKYKSLSWKSILVLLIGSALVVLIPWSLDRML
jgi:hypothetical protein